MEIQTDVFYEELLYLQECLKGQPDASVKAAIIQQPYKNFFIKTYQIYFSHLKKYQLHKKQSIIESFIEKERDAE